MRLKRSRFTSPQSLRLCVHVVAGTPARTAADLIGVNKNTAALFYHRMRQIIAEHVEDDSPLQGEIELSERPASMRTAKAAAIFFMLPPKP